MNKYVVMATIEMMMTTMMTISATRYNVPALKINAEIITDAQTAKR